MPATNQRPVCLIPFGETESGRCKLHVIAACAFESRLSREAFKYANAGGLNIGAIRRINL